MHREAAVGCAQLADLQLRPRLLQLRGRLQRAVTRLLDRRRRLSEARAGCSRLEDWLERTEDRCRDGPLSEDQMEVRFLDPGSGTGRN